MRPAGPEPTIPTWVCMGAFYAPEWSGSDPGSFHERECGRATTGAGGAGSGPATVEPRGESLRFLGWPNGLGLESQTGFLVRPAADKPTTHGHGRYHAGNRSATEGQRSLSS